MTSVMLRDMIGKYVPNQLQSKDNFDKVQEVESKKPEIVVSGSDENKTGSLADKPQLNGTHFNSIVAEPSNFRKEIGSAMSIDFQDEGYIKLPRSILSSSNWRDLSYRYKSLFIYILELVLYKPGSYTHKGVEIPLVPGQYCITYRRLVDQYNKSIKFKKEHIDASFLQRAVLLYRKFSWADTLPDTTIMCLTITHPELSEHFRKLNDTAFDTETIQKRYINEERKKEKNMKETIDRASAPDRSPLLYKKEEEQTGPSIFDAEPSSQSKELSEENQKMLGELWKFAQTKNVNDGNTKSGKPGVKYNDLIIWLKAGYEARDIAEAIKIASTKEIRITFGAYITKLLKEKIPKKKGNVEINDEFLNEIMKTHRCAHLENKKQYVTDNVKHTDYQKNTEPKLFKEMIMASIAMAKNYENREPDHMEERDCEDDY